MANLHHLVTIAGRFLMVGVLFFILEGCQTPLVKIDVAATTKAAPTGKCAPGEEEDGHGLSGCSDRSWSGSADGFWNVDSQSWIPSGSGLTCSASGSKKCRRGNQCFGGGGTYTCTNNYSNSPTTGTCFCACGPQ